MESRFENKIILSKDLFYEFLKVIYKKSKTILCLLSVFLLIDSMALFLIEDFVGFYFGLIFGVFFLFGSPAIFSIKAKQSYKEQLLCFEGKNPEKTTEFADRIHVISSNKAESFFDYPQITQICETKNLLILKITRSLGIVLDKNAFAADNLAFFRVFIQQKCPNAKYVVHINIGKNRAPSTSISLNPNKK